MSSAAMNVDLQYVDTDFGSKITFRFHFSLRRNKMNFTGHKKGFDTNMFIPNEFRKIIANTSEEVTAFYEGLTCQQPKHHTLMQK